MPVMYVVFNLSHFPLNLLFRDGLTAVRELRKLEASGELPNRNRVIALTGNARAGQIQTARDAGMDDVIVSSTKGLTVSLLTRPLQIKPYKIDELMNVIRRQE